VGVAAFIDAGNAVDSLSDASALGYASASVRRWNSSQSPGSAYRARTFRRSGLRSVPKDARTRDRPETDAPAAGGRSPPQSALGVLAVAG
jgi:hypothetical protein